MFFSALSLSRPLSFFGIRLSFHQMLRGDCLIRRYFIYDSQRHPVATTMVIAVASVHHPSHVSLHVRLCFFVRVFVCRQLSACIITCKRIIIRIRVEDIATGGKSRIFVPYMVLVYQLSPGKTIYIYIRAHTYTHPYIYTDTRFHTRIFSYSFVERRCINVLDESDSWALGYSWE